MDIDLIIIIDCLCKYLCINNILFCIKEKTLVD